MTGNMMMQQGLPPGSMPNMGLLPSFSLAYGVPRPPLSPYGAGLQLAAPMSPAGHMGAAAPRGVPVSTLPGAAAVAAAAAAAAAAAGGPMGMPVGGLELFPGPRNMGGGGITLQHKGAAAGRGDGGVKPEPRPRGRPKSS
eukprot:jgi/Mesen1/2056/ME000150S01144